MGSLRSPTGQIVVVPDDQEAHAILNGFQPVSNAEAGATTAAITPEDRGALGAVNAGATSLLSGLTLGSSDYALKGLLNRGDFERMAQERAAHPTISTAGQIGGAILPALLTGGGSLEAEGAGLGAKTLAASPSGIVTDIGSKIAALGEGGGFATKAAARIAGGGFEGALQNAGAYVADTALGDRDLSSEGFLGAMGEGAMWGGGASGALTLAERGMVALRRLLPKQALTREAVEAAEQKAAQDMVAHVDDGSALEIEGTKRLREIRNVTSTENPAVAERVNAAESTANAAHASRLEAQLREMQGRINTGESIGEIGATAPDVEGYRVSKGIETGKLRLPEEAAHRELAASTGPGSEADRIVKAQDAIRESREMMQRWTGETKPPAGTRVEFDASGRRIPWSPGATVRGADVVAETAPTATREAIATHADAFDHNLVDAAHAIGKHESASAELADILGPTRVGASSLDHAAALRQAEAEQSAKLADATVEHASKLSDAAKTTPPPKTGKYEGAFQDDGGRWRHPDGRFLTMTEQAARANEAAGVAGESAPAAKSPGMLGKIWKAAGHAGEVIETLHTLGVPGVPDPNDIPIIGPIAKLFLRAKIASKIFRRGAGQVLATAETGVASKAAATRNRVLGAVDNALSGGTKTLAKLAPAGGGAAAILGHRLFDDGTPAKKTTDLTEAFRQRARELSAATPESILALVQQKVPASDPSITDAIASALTRQVQFLQAKLPKPDSVRGLLGDGQWQPSKTEMESFGQSVKGATDPSSVIERACAGGRVSVREMEAVKAVYPRLFAEAQRRLLDGIIDKGTNVDHARRVQMSLMFDLPLTRSMEPKFAAFLQQAYQPATASPQGGGAPTIKAGIDIGSRATTRLDKG